MPVYWFPPQTPAVAEVQPEGGKAVRVSRVGDRTAAAGAIVHCLPESALAGSWK